VLDLPELLGLDYLIRSFEGRSRGQPKPASCAFCKALGMAV
jgi:hypothetical protein